MAFILKAFHNFKKTLKGELLVRGSREGKSLHIINGKHTKNAFILDAYMERNTGSLFSYWLIYLLCLSSTWLGKLGNG